MSSAANDLQLRELRDTISQLNTTIRIQAETTQKQLDELTTLIKEKDAVIANLNAQLDFLKNKLYGSTSEKNKPFPGQYSLFDDEEPEKPVALLEPEFVDVATHKRARKPKAT